MAEMNDAYYLRHVTDLAQKRPVVAHQAIYSRTGMKLVDVGTRLTEALFDKLVVHKILPPIDESLGIEDEVSNLSLRRDLEAMLLEIPSLGGPSATESEREYLLKVFDQMPLAKPLAFKLTVMREQRPDIFQHSLQVALVAVSLAATAGFKTKDLTPVAAAALFHDIGLLHIDPDALRGDAQLDDERLRALDTHPIVAHLILRTIPEWNLLVASAVLEHHERLDGSGYPRQLSGVQLSSLGQLLAVAELGAAILLGKGGATKGHLSVALRFNEGKLNSGYARTLLEFLWNRELNDQGASPGTISAICSSFEKVSAAISELRDIERQLPAGWQTPPLLESVQGRLDQLTRNFARTGIDLSQITKILQDPKIDSESVTELHWIATEAQWQVRAISREIRRKLRGLPLDNEAVRLTVFGWLASIERG